MCGSMCVSVSVFVSLCALSCMAYAMHIHNVHLHTLTHTRHTDTLVWHIERCVCLSVGILFNTFALALYFLLYFISALLTSCYVRTLLCRTAEFPTWKTRPDAASADVADVGADNNVGAAS